MPIPAADIPESQAVGATPQPLTITGRVPLPNARAASLTTAIKAVFQDGTTTLDQNSVVLKVDDQTVTFAKDFTNGITTISYQPSQVFLARSVHTVNVAYKDNTGAALSDTWSFTVQDYFTIPATAAVQPDTTKQNRHARQLQAQGVDAVAILALLDAYGVSARLRDCPGRRDFVAA